MSTDHDTRTRPSSDDPDDAAVGEPTAHPGPDLLAERTLAGIFVHLLGVLTSFLGPLVVYAVSDHEFTRANARNAANWQLLYASAFLVALGAFGVAFLADTVLPDPVVAVALLVVFAAVLGLVLLGFLDLVFSVVATGKAVFGSAWAYPLAPDFLELDRSRVPVGVPRWTLLGPYVVAAPLMFAALLGTAVGVGPGAALPDGALVGAILFGFVTALAATVVLAIDVAAVRRADAAWTPRWSTYLGAPVAGGVVTYLAATYYYGSANPGGDAVYGAMAVLWPAVVVYLYRRYTAGDTSVDD